MEAGTSVSVVIPVYDDPDGLSTTLEALVEQTYPADDHEVLVVDNGSSDHTPEVAHEFAREHPERVTMLVEDQIQGSYAARNKGIRNASGDLIAFVDADMSVDDTWLESVVASHEEEGWDYMGCDVRMYQPGPSSSLVGEYNELFSLQTGKWLGEYDFAPTCCLVVERSVFDDVGLFDSRLVSAGDAEFGHRVADAGYEQHFAEEIPMYHPVRTSAASTASRYVRIGKGRAQMETYHDRGEGAGLGFRLVYYLPPYPPGFLRRLRERSEKTGNDPPAHRVLGLYLVEYMTKLAIVVGRLKAFRSDLTAGEEPTSSATV